MRNVVPRQGTETVERHFAWIFPRINEKCSSPTGDGNNFQILCRMRYILMRNVVPRQGTETILLFL